MVKVAEPVATAFDVSLSPFGDTLAYVRQDTFGVYTQPATGGPASLLFTLPVSPSQGILSFIPSGEVLVLFQEVSGSYTLNVFSPAGGDPKVSVPGISQAFVAQAALKPRRGSNGGEFMLKPYGLSAINMVLAVGGELRLYSAGAGGFVGPTLLPRSVDATLQGLLALRPADDVTSGLLSADGRRLLLRTRDGAGHGLYAVNLDVTSGPVALVTGAGSPPGYTFAPATATGPAAHQAVYEAGGGLTLYDFDTGVSTRLTEGAFSPGWH